MVYLQLFAVSEKLVRAPSFSAGGVGWAGHWAGPWPWAQGPGPCALGPGWELGRAGQGTGRMRLQYSLGHEASILLGLWLCFINRKRIDYVAIGNTSRYTSAFL